MIARESQARSKGGPAVYRELIHPGSQAPDSLRRRLVVKGKPLVRTISHTCHVSSAPSEGRQGLLKSQRLPPPSSHLSGGGGNKKTFYAEESDRQRAEVCLTSDGAHLNGQANHLNLFNNRQQAKKKRKSRTAFTNHQIFELEKRFLYQKYLSPADRDEIAGQLGLSNAQVITWFQNRRAKLKRDMEELKKDVETSKILTAHKSFLENVQDLGILKKKSGTSAMISDDKMISALNIVSEK
uniref:Homeobox domain-containing protein n=1 Tax=Timema douglasi TaxID=61478 RepID=A0A7R8Z8Z4_TIMDO|nr:unnamed protein product [Timema douglasi]